MASSCLIIGGGIVGLTTALALHKIGVSSTVYELRASPSTIGGAVNLTPNGLKLLDSLGVEVEPYGCRVDSIEIYSLHSGASLGELPFKKSGPALRILREHLLQALLRAVKKNGIRVDYDSKLVSIKEDEGGNVVTAVFANGREVKGDFLLGCDGIHSSVRTQYVDRDRKPIYTDVAVAYSVLGRNDLEVNFKSTAMLSGSRGSLLASFVDQERTKIYLGAVMSTPEQQDKQGWKVRGKDGKKTLDEVERRYKNSGIPYVDDLIARVNEFVFYPVYNLGPGGKWSKGKVLLLGDAAHGMPPQGESTGLAIEDGVLFARVLSSIAVSNVEKVFEVYEKTRRSRIDVAYKEAAMRWENVKDRSWFGQKVLEWMMWAVLWFKMSSFETSMAYDVRKEELVG